MSWTPATSISPRTAHLSRIRVRATSDVCESRPGREHRESTHPSQSHREGPDSSLGSVPLFSRRSTPLGPFFSTFAHCLRSYRGDARTLFYKRKCVYSAQFWCNLNPLDATLLSLLLCVANKELAQHLSPVDATLTKNRGWGQSQEWGYPSILPSLPRYLLTSTRPLPGGAHSGVN